ncbi:DUF4411 family protein [Ornithinimicrobium flavum]|uniref:DUF4411 family protein n=1 Tax=Ornithinimicrobium flavum TaxID=1288636 RepID=UPI00106FFF30|nr:DUF4411 family protein [Ornithinimicrobium flavum]
MGLYSFDTSALINGRRDLLPPATFPSVWERIEGMIASKEIFCVDEVEKELAKRDGDAIHTWARSQNGLFVPLDEDVQVATTEVLAAHPKLLGAGKGRNAADPFVVGLARVKGGAVVTEERAANLNKPKIPDVCAAMGVPCVTLVEFISDQGWTF